MAQHDFAISNGSGKAVREDIDAALKALVSNNSGNDEPSPTYAYQFWADTNAGLLKIRNAANNAWVTLRELDGTLSIEAGTVSAPGLYFTGDPNTGLYSPAADQLAITTGGVERVEWGTSEVVFNDGGADYDFRVEGDTKASLLLVDASADTVSVDGTAQLANQTPLRFGDSDNSHYVALRAAGTVAANVTWDLPSADGTADQVLKTNGSGALGWATPLTQGSVITSGTAVASTSGTSIDFTGIPSWVKRITVMLSGVSTNGTSNILLQLGAGSITSSGYTSQAVQTATGSISAATSTSGLITSGAFSASALYSGCAQVATLGSNVWASSGTLGSGAAGNVNYSCGTVTLSGTLDRVRITTVNGTDTFDAGTINILYEG